MYRACCRSSISPSAGRVVSLGVGRVNIDCCGASSGPSLAIARSEGSVVPGRLHRGVYAVVVNRKRETTPSNGRSERRVHAMREEEGAVQEMTRRPVLLVDVMGTIVRDPFHVDMPAFFGLTFKELMAGKHPTAWMEFERGHLTEEEFAVKLFNDRRNYDYEGLKQCMAGGYEYLEGMEALLQRLKVAGFDMHVFSNYPCWYTMIEEKLKVSQYLPWTFVSCHTGLRKPAPEAFLDAAEWLGVNPSDCVFIDDQARNVEAASKAGMLGIQFKNAQVLEKELTAYGISLDPFRRAQKTS